MKLTTMKFYDGNNIKRHKYVIRIIFMEGTKEKVEKLAHYYIGICKKLNLEERIIEIEEKKTEIHLWITYTEEEVTKSIWQSLLHQYSHRNDDLHIDKYLSIEELQSVDEQVSIDRNILVNKHDFIDEHQHVYEHEYIHELIKRCKVLMGDPLIKAIKRKGSKYGIPIISINEDDFQIGYGKNSVFISKGYQSYENMVTSQGTMNRKWLWDNLVYNNFPVVNGRVIYDYMEILEDKYLNLNHNNVTGTYPITICSVNKFVNNKVIIENRDGLKEKVDEFIHKEGRAFIYTVQEEYRIIIIEGRVKTIIQLKCKDDKYVNYNIDDEFIKKQSNSLAENLYKVIPIKFMYMDIMVKDEKIYIVDVGNVFNIKSGINMESVESISEVFLTYLKTMGVGTIPLFSITGTNGKTSTARLLYHVLNGLGFYTGLTNTGTIFIGEEVVEKGDTTGYLSARKVLTNSKVEAAVLEIARGGIIRNGLSYEGANAAIITSLSEDHLGLDEIYTLEDLGGVKTVILEEVRAEGKWILRGQENLIRAARSNLEKKWRATEKNYFENKAIIFDLEKTFLIEEHIRNGGEAFYLEGEMLIHHVSGEKLSLINIKEIPFTHFGISKGNILNVISVLAAGTTLDVPMERIIKVIETIPCDIKHNPGRQNILEFKDYKVMLDYGHNPEAYEAVFSIVKNLKPTRVTSIITAPGDRLDEHIERLGHLAGKVSDFIIIREQQDSRGSELGRVGTLLETGVLSSGLERNKISFISEGGDALIYAMKRAIKGELIVIFTEELENVIKKLNEYLVTIGERQIGI